MQVIYFKSKDQKDQWDEFIAKNCPESFLQLWEWGEFQRDLNRKIWKIGIVENGLSSENKTKASSIKHQASSDNLTVTTLIVKHNLLFGRSYLYCPKGPVINQKFIKSIKSKVHKVEILDLLFGEIRKIAKKEKSLFLKIDPPISCRFHSGDIHVEPGRETCARGSTAIKGLWSQHCGFKKSPNEIQPKNTIMLDLTKSEEKLLLEMKPKTRYNIRLAKKKDVRVFAADDYKKYFSEFWKLMDETARRDGFRPHNKDYYWKMLESLNFCDEVNENCHSEFISESIGDKDLSCFKFVEQSAGKIEDVGDYRKKILKQVQDDNRDVRRDNKNLQARLYLAEYNKKIIAANIVLFFGDLAVYLHGASSNEHRNVMAPHLLQWKQILDAKKAGCKVYDFWGAEESSKFKVQSSKLRKKDWSGITRFKKGFGGFEKNYIGAYDLAFNEFEYWLYRFLKKIMRNFK